MRLLVMLLVLPVGAEFAAIAGAAEPRLASGMTGRRPGHHSARFVSRRKIFFRFRAKTLIALWIAEKIFDALVFVSYHRGRRPDRPSFRRRGPLLSFPARMNSLSARV